MLLGFETRNCFYPLSMKNQNLDNWDILIHHIRKDE